jgi:hypothetical protein
VGVGEADTSVGKAVDVWSWHKRLACRVQRQVVEVIDDDKEKIGLGAGTERKKGEAKASPKYSHLTRLLAGRSKEFAVVLGC